MERQSIGPYRIVSQLGDGGMSIIYEAVSPEGAAVAIKVVRPEIANQLSFRRRFSREIEIYATLDHPGIVHIQDFSLSEDVCYLVMDLVRGELLSDRMSPGRPSPVGWATEIVVQLLDTLSYIHQRGIVHRDLKPANIMLDADGSPILLDFGVAFVPDGHAITMIGDVIGTLAYAAPEQIQGRPPAPTMDLYSIGLIYYEMITGRRAFPNANNLRQFMQVLSERPPPPSDINHAVGKQVNAAVLRALEKSPADRAASAAAMAVELRTALAEDTMVTVRASRRVRDLAGLRLERLASNPGAPAGTAGEAPPAGQKRAAGDQDRQKLSEAGNAVLNHELALVRADLEALDRERLKVQEKDEAMDMVRRSLSMPLDALMSVGAVHAPKTAPPALDSIEPTIDPQIPKLLNLLEEALSERARMESALEESVAVARAAHVEYEQRLLDKIGKLEYELAMTKVGTLIQGGIPRELAELASTGYIGHGMLSEIGRPLTTVALIASKLFSEHSFDPRGRVLMSQLRSAIRQVGSVVLSLARMPLDQPRRYDEPDLQRLVEKVARFLASKLQRRNQTLSRDLPEKSIYLNVEQMVLEHLLTSIVLFFHQNIPAGQPIAVVVAVATDEVTIRVSHEGTQVSASDVQASLRWVSGTEALRYAAPAIWARLGARIGCSIDATYAEGRGTVVLLHFPRELIASDERPELPDPAP